MDEERVIAIVLDGHVIEVARFNERFAALLMSNPEFVDVTASTVGQGWTYKDGQFSKMIGGELKSFSTDQE